MFHRSRAPIALALAALLTAGGFAVATAARSSHSHSESSSSSNAGYLGVNLQDLEGDLKDSYDFEGNGVVVSSVVPGSPADKVGVEEGDIITRFNDLAVNSADQLTARVRSLSPGSLASISVWRDGKVVDLGRVELGRTSDRDDDNDWSYRAAPRAPRAPRTPRAPVAPMAPYGNWQHAMPGAQAFLSLGRGRLGVETQDLDSDLGGYFDTPDGKGVLVLKVLEDTPAEKADLKAGDVILSIDGDAVSDGDELRKELRSKDAGPVELKVRRKGAVRTIRATLEDPQPMHGMMGNGNPNWMGWMDGMSGKDKGEHRVYRFHSDNDGDGTGEMRIDGMSDEDQAQLRKDLDELRKDLEDMRREMKNSR